jgi:hypothetical protein
MKGFPEFSRVAVEGT